jgi:threonine/homoserine/homoserine lactone efflux protein
MKKEASDKRLLDLVVTDILQINAAVVAGALFFLTFVATLNSPDSTQEGIKLSLTISTVIVMAFSICSLIALFNRRQAAINAMKVEFGISLPYGPLLFISTAVLPHIFDN